MRNGIIWDERSFRRYERALKEGTSQKLLRKHIQIANGRSALLIQREARQGIKAGIPPKNAPLTIAIKKSSKPLVDNGDLFAAITTHQTSWHTAFVGILRTEEFFDIAKTLHDGKRIPVTDAMRGLFFVLWLASVAHREGRPQPPLTGRAAELFAEFQDWAPLSQDTRVIKIPARPFIANVFARDDIKQAVCREWATAIDRAIKESIR